MMIACTSISGSPGVTSWALILALAWATPQPDESDRRTCIIECDPDGGVLGCRYDVGVNPGVASLIASTRRDHGLEVSRHGREVADSVFVIPSSESALTCESVLAAGGEALGETLAEDRSLWFVDLGRASRSPITGPLQQAAAMTILWTRAERESIIQVPAAVTRLQMGGRDVIVAVVGKSGYEPNELQRFFGSQAVIELPSADNLPRLAARLVEGGRIRRHPAWTAALDAVTIIRSFLPTPPPQRTYWRPEGAPAK